VVLLKQKFAEVSFALAIFMKTFHLEDFSLAFEKVGLVYQIINNILMCMFQKIL
jgi:hypothetical protein